MTKQTAALITPKQTPVTEAPKLVSTAKSNPRLSTFLKALRR